MMSRWIPDDRWVYWLVLPVIVFLSQSINDAHLLDFWHHLARGDAIIRTGALVDHDIFTYTLGERPFRDINWLTQIGYHYLFSWGGLETVRFVNSSLLALTWLWLVILCNRESGSLRIAVLAGMITFLGCWEVLTIRPQTLSLLLFVGLFDVLLRAERDVRWLLPVPLFLMIWPNLHGAFAAGLILLAGFAFGQIASTWRTPTFRRTLLYCGGISVWRAVHTQGNVIVYRRRVTSR